MATMVNRDWHWAAGHKVIPCRCIEQCLESATATVILPNGGRHTIDAIDLCYSPDDAEERNTEKARVDAIMAYIADCYPNVL